MLFTSMPTKSTESRQLQMIQWCDRLTSSTKVASITSFYAVRVASINNINMFSVLIVYQFQPRIWSAFSGNRVKPICPSIAKHP